MAAMDQEFVEYVVKALVNHPEDVAVERSVDDDGVLLKLQVNEEDMGRVIGKSGATAKSIRKLLWVLGAKNDEKISLKIVEPDGEEIASDDDTVEEPETERVVDPEVARSEELREQTKKELEELDMEL